MSLPPDVSAQPARGPAARKSDRRVAVRTGCSIEATSQALDEVETISWGAVVEDISATGLGIILCYPFRPGTYLAVDLDGPGGTVRTVLVRVVHVRDRFDGAWHIGCEFVKPLSQSDVDVARAGQDVREHHRNDRAAPHEGTASFAIVRKSGSSLSNVVSSASGTRRVCAVTVMKFESPPHRGTMWRW